MNAIFGSYSRFWRESGWSKIWALINKDIGNGMEFKVVIGDGVCCPREILEEPEEKHITVMSKMNVIVDE